jgi:hypothetical protein
MYAECMKESFHIGEGIFCFEINNFDYPGFYTIEFEDTINEIPILYG